MEIPKDIEGLLWGKDIDPPKDVKDLLFKNEKVICALQQSRATKLITPQSIFVTTERIVLHKPKTFGLRRDLEDYKYVDMANTKIKQGFISSSIIVKMRFLSNDVVIDGIPRKPARYIFKLVQDGVTGRLSEVPVFGAPMGSTKAKETKEEDEDLLKLLKKRYIKGEISKKEYNEMKKELLPEINTRPKKGTKKAIKV